MSEILQKKTNFKRKTQVMMGTARIDTMPTHEIISGKELLQKLGLLLLDSLDDEIVIGGEIKERSTGAWIGKLPQRLMAEGKLRTQETNKQEHR